jgi:hypothetical protein
MKRLFLAVASLFYSMIVLSAEPVNEKVMQAFTQSFKNVQDVVGTSMQTTMKSCSNNKTSVQG